MQQKNKRPIHRLLAILMTMSLAFVMFPAASGSAVNVAAKKACCGNKITIYKEVVPANGSGYAKEAAGQVRVSSGKLQDSNGNQIGKFSSTHTIMSINDNGTRTIQDIAHLTLWRSFSGKSNSTIITQGLVDWPTGGYTPSSGTTNHTAITGGTGAYSGVTGGSTGTLLAKGYYKNVLKFKNR